MAQSSGSGGRATTGASAVLPEGFKTGRARVETHRGKTATPIPGLSAGLLETLRHTDGVFEHVAENKSQDLSFQAKVRAWAKDNGVIAKFTSPDTAADGKVTRGAWCELASDASDEVKARVAALQAS